MFFSSFFSGMSRKRKNAIIESDDENFDDSRDRDWTPDDDDGETSISSRNSSVGDRQNELDTSVPEDDFNSTDGFNLKVIKSMKQSNHLIWSMFGNLLKDGKIVDKVKHRIYCIKCFEKKRFKR